MEINFPPTLPGELGEMKRRIESLERVGIASRPMVSVLRGSQQSIPDSVKTSIAWTGVYFDNMRLWDASQPTLLHLRLPGVWQVIAVAHFSANASGIRMAEIMMDSFAPFANDHRIASPSGPTAMTLNELLLSNGERTIELNVTQTSGGALDIGATSTAGTELVAFWTGVLPGGVSG